MTILERFMQRVVMEPNSGCWLWDGPVGKQGYGTHSRHFGTHRAHRISYILHKGPIPDDLPLDHLCRVRCCVNPDHLEAVTTRENILRGIGPTALNAVKTHCPVGHPYSEKNTHYDENGGRHCRKCWADGARAKLRRQHPDGFPLRKDNTSGFKGVYWIKRAQRWRAQIKINKRSKEIGTYKTREEAARAYDSVAREYGYQLNFPDTPSPERTEGRR